MSSHVREHVPDLCRLLADVHAAMAPGGLFFAEMPDHYLGATNPIERRAHLELYEAFQTSAEPVQLRWVKNERSSGSRATVTVHVVFTDCAGTLNAITSALLEAGVGIFGTKVRERGGGRAPGGPVAAACVRACGRGRG